MVMYDEQVLFDGEDNQRDHGEIKWTRQYKQEIWETENGEGKEGKAWILMYVCTYICIYIIFFVSQIFCLHCLIHLILSTYWTLIHHNSNPSNSTCSPYVIISSYHINLFSSIYLIKSNFTSTSITISLPLFLSSSHSTFSSTLFPKSSCLILSS